MRYLIAFFLALACSYAHPHVFVDTFLDIRIDAEERAHLKVTWRFDDMVSQQFLMDWDANGNGQFEQEEIAEVKYQSFDTLENIDYFTAVTLDYKPHVMGKAEGFTAYVKNHKVHYTFVFTDPIPLNGVAHLGLSCYDPEYFVSMELKEEFITLQNSGKRMVEKTVKRSPARNGIVSALAMNLK